MSRLLRQTILNAVEHALWDEEICIDTYKSIVSVLNRSGEIIRIALDDNQSVIIVIDDK